MGTSSDSVTVALIAALGTVLVALVGLAAQWLSRSPRSSLTLPAPDPQLGEKLAILVDHDETDRRTLDQLDRHVDGIGDRVDRHQWRLDDHDAVLEQIRRRLGMM